MLSLPSSALLGSLHQWVLASFWTRNPLFRMISGAYCLGLPCRLELTISRKWSCGNHKKGIVSDALDFNLVCHVVSFGWKFGLVQASLELLTFIISVTSFTLLKYAYFVRYGALGKLFWRAIFVVISTFSILVNLAIVPFWLVLNAKWDAHQFFLLFPNWSLRQTYRRRVYLIRFFLSHRIRKLQDITTALHFITNPASTSCYTITHCLQPTPPSPNMGLAGGREWSIDGTPHINQENMPS